MKPVIPASGSGVSEPSLVQPQQLRALPNLFRRLQQALRGFTHIFEQQFLC